MFRIRKSFLGGNCILQVSDGDRWNDAYSTPDLETGFHIVSLGYIAEMQEKLDELDAIKAKRSAASRAGWAKKRAPVLTEAVTHHEVSFVREQGAEVPYTLTTTPVRPQAIDFSRTLAIAEASEGPKP